MKGAIKKYRLVDDDEWLRQKELRNYDPELSSSARQQSTLHSVLDDKTMSADMKLKLMRALLHNVTPIEQHIKPEPVVKKVVTTTFDQPEMKKDMPVHVEALPPDMDAEDQQPAQAVESVGQKFEEVVEKMPASYRSKARRLAQLLDSNPTTITVNTSDEIVVAGKPVRHSNAASLFKYIFSPGRKSAPHGYAIFVKTLAHLRIPPHYVANRMTKELLADALQTGRGKIRKIIGFAKRPRPVRQKPQAHPRPAISNLKSLKLYKI